MILVMTGTSSQATPMTIAFMVAFFLVLSSLYVHFIKKIKLQGGKLLASGAQDDGYKKQLKLDDDQLARPDECIVQDLPLPPGAGARRVVWESLQFLRAVRRAETAAWVAARMARHGSCVFRTNLFTRPAVVTSGPDASRFLFSHDGKLVRPFWPPTLVSLLGDSSFLAAPETANRRRLRRIVHDCAGSPALRRLLTRVDSLTIRHLALHWIGRRQLPAHHAAAIYTLEVSFALLLGGGRPPSSRTRDALQQLYTTLTAGVFTLGVYLPGTRYYKAHQAKVRLHRLLRELVSERREQLLHQPGDHGPPFVNDLVSYMVLCKDEHGQAFSHDEIVHLATTILLASQDTVHSAITFACKHLAQNPAVYDNVVKEQRSILESKKHGDALTWEDLNKMEYTWSVIQESLRLQPPALGVFYVATKDFEYNHFRIPCGWLVFLSISHCHMDQRYFTNPDKFDPSRFFDKIVKPNTFIPFCGGPRLCGGIDFTKVVMLIFFHYLVNFFKWTLENPNEGISMGITPYPMQGLPIILEEKTS